MEPKSINTSKLKKKAGIVKRIFIVCISITSLSFVLSMNESIKTFLGSFVSLGTVTAVSAALSVISLLWLAYSLDSVFYATRDARMKFIRIFNIPPDGVYNSVDDSVVQTLRILFLKAISELSDVKLAQKTDKLFQSERTQERLNIAIVQFGETREMLKEAAETALDWGFSNPTIIEYFLQSVDDEI